MVFRFSDLDYSRDEHSLLYILVGFNIRPSCQVNTALYWFHFAEIKGNSEFKIEAWGKYGWWWTMGP